MNFTKLAKGEIAALSGAGDDARYFQISAPCQPGNSGGALVDAAGNVVGIVSAKLDAATALAASGALPEVLADGHQLNCAIKSSFLLKLTGIGAACFGQVETGQHEGGEV